MSEMIERVAKEMADVVNDTTITTQEARAICKHIVPLARAAIRAMREPSDEMWRAGMPHVDSLSSNTAFWRAMIDEALK